MGIENPHAKLNQARVKSDERKEESARRPGTLNPAGKGGPIHDQLKHSFETLGTEQDDDEKVTSIRELFESKLRRRALTIYNQHLQGEKGSPSPEKFEKEVEKAFRHGLDMYLKVMLRLDEKEAPGPHEPYQAHFRNYGKRWIYDEHNKDYYLKNYLISGTAVKADLTPHHDYEPEEEQAGYATKYQRTSNKSDEAAAIDAYMFEKVRFYSKEFFDLLEESLKRNVKYKMSLELAEFAYGNNANIYNEMEKHGLDAHTVAIQSWVNRARVRLPFEKYIAVGEALQEKYPYEAGSGGWVTSPVMIRNLIFKHPQTVEAGLAIVDRELSRLRKQFPDVPQKLLIDKCVSAPDHYEEEIKKFVDEVEVLMEQHPTEEQYGVIGEPADNTNVFAHYEVVGSLMRLVHRVSVKSRSSEVERALTAFSDTLQQAEQKDIALIYNGKRRILKSLLGYRTSPTNALKREERISRRHEEDYQRLLERAAQLDPERGHIWNDYYVDLGYGDSNDEILETGKAIVDLVIDQYGEADAEEYLSDCLDRFMTYVDNGFSEDPGDLDALKDSLIMDPYNPRVWYESYHQRDWPEGVNEITPGD